MHSKLRQLCKTDPAFTFYQALLCLFCMRARHAFSQGCVENQGPLWSLLSGAALGPRVQLSKPPRIWTGFLGEGPPFFSPSRGHWSPVFGPLLSRPRGMPVIGPQAQPRGLSSSAEERAGVLLLSQKNEDFCSMLILHSLPASPLQQRAGQAWGKETTGHGSQAPETQGLGGEESQISD